MPQVKRFLKESGGLLSYEGTSVHWSPGKPPVLAVYPDDGEAEFIDLSNYGYDALHELMRNKGFAKKPDEKAADL